MTLIYNYTRRQKLTKADEFSSVFNLRRTIQNKYLQAFIRPNGLDRARLGLVVAKRVARHAVKRNYMKRVIREYFRLHAIKVQGFDIVVRVKLSFYRAEAQWAKEALHGLWKKIEQCRA